MHNEKDKVNDEEIVNDNTEFSGFKRGDTMVLIGDYTDDSDYAFYMDIDIEETPLDKSEFEDKKNLDEENQELEEDNTNNEKRKGLMKFIVAFIVILFIIGGLITYRLIDTKVFPKGTVLNGVNVENLDVEKAGDKLEKELNTITLIKDGNNLGRADTLYKFNKKKAAKKSS